jgi:hypothetical protein
MGRSYCRTSLFTCPPLPIPDLKYTARCDETGLCRFAALPPDVSFDASVVGPHGIHFRRSEPIRLQPGARERLEWDLRGAEIVGHVPRGGWSSGRKHHHLAVERRTR